MTWKYEDRQSMCDLNAFYMEKKGEDGEGCKGFKRWYG